MMMDEPVAGLDVDGKLLVKDLIKKLASKKVSMVLSPHDLFEHIPLIEKLCYLIHFKISFDIACKEEFPPRGRVRTFHNCCLALYQSSSSISLSTALTSSSRFAAICSISLLKLLPLSKNSTRSLIHL